MAAPANEPLTDLLKNVSRSFYLTLRVLPGKIRSQIGLAYLLARTSDTIADTELVALEARLRALQALSERIQGARQTPIGFSDFLGQQGSPHERRLLEQVEQVVALLGCLTPADLQRVRQVLQIIMSGQELDLVRFGGASGRAIAALGTETELEDYIYRV